MRTRVYPWHTCQKALLSGFSFSWRNLCVLGDGFVAEVTETYSITNKYGIVLVLSTESKAEADGITDCPSWLSAVKLNWCSSYFSSFLNNDELQGLPPRNEGSFLSSVPPSWCHPSVHLHESLQSRRHRFDQGIWPLWIKPCLNLGRWPTFSQRFSVWHPSETIGSWYGVVVHWFRLFSGWWCCSKRYATQGLPR